MKTIFNKTAHDSFFELAEATPVSFFLFFYTFSHTPFFQKVRANPKFEAQEAPRVPVGPVPCLEVLSLRTPIFNINQPRQDRKALDVISIPPSNSRPSAVKLEFKMLI